MANFNKVMLIGNLTRDPQLSYTPNQTAVVDFGLAINRRWTGQDGSQRDETCFVDCRMFGKRAEVVNKYCKKGNPLFVEGRLTFDSWQAQDGSKRSKLKVTVESFEFLGGGDGGGGSGQARQSYGGQDQAGQSYGGGSPAAAPAQPPVGDDDIPF
jgi:single-strand DNA-binding protein